MTANNGLFTPQNTVEMQLRSLAKRRAKPKKNTLQQATELQRTLHEAGIIIGNDVKDSEDKQERARIGSALASIAKGWDAMSARIQSLKGRPSPGTLSPAERRAKAQREPVNKSAPRPAPKPAPESPD